MALTKIAGHQYPLYATGSLGHAAADFDAASGGLSFSVPAGAILTDLIPFVTEAYDGGTSVGVTIADGTNTFASAVTVKATGIVATSGVSGTYYPNGGTITVKVAEGGTASTAGGINVTVGYVVVNRVNEP